MKKALKDQYTFAITTRFTPKQGKELEKIARKNKSKLGTLAREATLEKWLSTDE